MADPEQLVVSANDLFDGDVVYLTPDGGWTRCLGEAAIATDKAASATLLRRAASQADRVVGPYLIGVNAREGVTEPLHIRDRLRQTGPSILTNATGTATPTQARG